MRSKFLLFFNTIRFLKLRQIYYQVWYRIIPLPNPPGKVDAQHSEKVVFSALSLEPGILARPTFSDNTFRFTGLEHHFAGEVDWNFQAHGKLWTYNLNYFDFLHQPGMTKETGLTLMKSWISQLHSGSAGMEPYPLSVRGINWIRFISLHGVTDQEIIRNLFFQYHALTKRVEYHLMGNHLLENGFSLLFAGFFFNDPQFLKKGEGILRRELQEQILNDGGHFELSPMYHQLILHRVLDSFNLTMNNPAIPCSIGELLRSSAERMLFWLRSISWKDGEIPMLNDSSPGIAPTTDQLYSYAGRLGITAGTGICLDDSGYRKFETADYELVVDVGQIGPAYIPGHAHADALNFELRISGKPFLVDTGTSTYENNEIRWYERGTRAHNTVLVGDADQSEVWESHRVGKRAGVTILEEDQRSVHASHDGYRTMKVIHSRRFSAQSGNIVIEDHLKGKTGTTGVALFHFHHKIKPVLHSDVIRTIPAIISFEGHNRVELRECMTADGFNNRVVSTVAEVTFTGQLKTTIELENPLSHR